MELSELLQVLAAHNETEKGYQIHLNSGCLDNASGIHTDVEFGDLYFTECSTLGGSLTLCFDNMNREPIRKTENGTDCYPMEVNSQMFISLDRVERIEDVKDFEDWFTFPSERVINIYMFPENNNLAGNRNVVTIGFMD